MLDPQETISGLRALADYLAEHPELQPVAATAQVYDPPPVLFRGGDVTFADMRETHVVLRFGPVELVTVLDPDVWEDVHAKYTPPEPLPLACAGSELPCEVPQ